MMSIDHIPKSAEEAIMMATNALSEEDKQLLRNTPEENLSMFHFSLCATIRNALGLWKDEAEGVLAAIAESDPTHPSVNDWGDSLSIDADGASALLVRTIRRRLIAVA